MFDDTLPVLVGCALTGVLVTLPMIVERSEQAGVVQDGYKVGSNHIYLHSSY